MREHPRRRRRCASGALTLTLTLAACSGDGATTEPSAAVAPTTVTPTEPTATATTSPTGPTAVTAASPTTTAITTTTTAVPPTTQPAPTLFPAATFWNRSVAASEFAAVNGLYDVDGTWWVASARYNVGRLLRSTDGVTFDEFLVADPPASGGLGIVGVVGRPDGGLLGYGQRATGCEADTPVDGGFVQTGLCDTFQPVIYLSDDTTTWRHVQPAQLAAPSGASNHIVDVVHDGSEYVALTYVTSDDWHVRLYSSPDGEQWTLRRELREPGGATAVALYFDGANYVVHIQAHPCIEPLYYGDAGWVRGSTWAEHDRFYIGDSLDTLAPADSGDSGVIPDPLPVDCAVTDGWAVAELPYPTVASAQVGGHVTLLDVSSPDAGRDPGAYPFTRLVEGVWVDGTIERPAPDDADDAADPFGDPLLFDLDGDPAVLEHDQPGGRPVMRTRLLTATGDHARAVTSRHLLLGSAITAVAADGGVIVAVGTLREPGSTGQILAWTSADTTDDPRRCDLAPGGECVAAVLAETAPAYPDLAGIDLSGADLSYSDLGDADLTGATLAGADLSYVDASDATLVGADFTGATLRGTNLSFLIGSPGPLDRAVLDGARLTVIEGEISLAGAGLTGASIGGLLSTSLLVIRDLTGATIADTSFRYVDLSAAAVDGVDLTGATFDEASICPDGQPPTGELMFSMTCVR